MDGRGDSHAMRIISRIAVLLVPLVLLPAAGQAQSTADQEAKTRAANIAAWPDAARSLFGQKTEPASMQARAIGSYARGCLAGAEALPVDGRIVGEWSIGPQEPPGRRQLDVVVEGRVAASFEFEVR